MGPVLVVAAHPDDEVLGCAGTIVKHVGLGQEVTSLFLTDGVGARGEVDRASLENRRAAARQAAKIMGTRPPRFFDFPDNRLDSLPLLDVVQAVESVIGQINPAIVYTHHGGDLNVDHRIAHRAVVTACRPLPGSTVSALYTFEVPSSTEWASPELDREFRPTRFIDISSSLETKLQALESYRDELRPFPHPRSIENVEALAKSRGAAAGLTAAEAFVVVREIVA